MGTITPRQRNRPALLLTLLLLAGCGGQFSQGPGSGFQQTMLEGLPDLASLPAEHQSSIAYNETLPGAEAFARAGAAVVSGDMLELPSTADALCWGIWAWDAAGHEITGVSYDIDLPAGNAFYIALADYSTGSWEIHGPQEAAVQFPPSSAQYSLDPARNISPGGMVYCAALTWNGDTATVLSVRLSIETGSALNEAEDNNTLSDANQLPPLPFADWRGHAGPPGAGGDSYDYYSFKAVDGQLVTISLSYDNLAANLRLSLYDTDQTVMVSADDGNPGLRVIRRGLMAGSYWLRVQAYSGESDYSLSISVETPGYDEVEDNDGFNTAQPLALPVTEFLGSCGPEGYNGDDLDYYSFTAAEGDLLSAGLDYASASANLYLRLYNEARATVVFDEAGNNGSRSLSWGLNAGTYYIRVSAFSGTADYTLALSLTHPGFDEVEDNDSFAGAQMLSLPVASFSGNAGEAGYDGDDYDYYAFSAAEGDQLSASLGYDNTQANLYLRLYSPGETTISSDEAGSAEALPSPPEICG